MILTLTPNPSVDQTLEINALIPGEVHRASGPYLEPSGKGVNVSRALTRNNVEQKAILPLGGLEGDALARLLEAEGVRFCATAISGSVRVNVSVTESSGQTTKINVDGPLMTEAEIHELTEALRRAVQPGDWVVGSGSLPRGFPSDYYAQVCRLVHEEGAQFVMDSSGEPFKAGLTGLPEVVKPNLEELEEALGRKVSTMGEAVAGAHELLDQGPTCILLSLGADGAVLVTAELVAHAAADSLVPPRSVIGAGDALLAGFVATGCDGERSLREAVIWASAAIGMRGSHVPLITAQHRGTVRSTDRPDLGRRLSGARGEV